mgnify:CR=1 FL=1
MSLDVIQVFGDILKKVKKNKPGLLVLIGDELADRGNNDWFTLQILNALHDAKIPFQIQLSNHGLQALAFFSGTNTGSRLKNGQEASLNNCQVLLQAFPVLKNQFKTLTRMYKTHLSLIGYQFEDNKKERLVLYTHAPIDIQTIRLIASEFRIHELDLSTVVGLVDCIDKINARFLESIRNDGFIGFHVKTVHYKKSIRDMYDNHINTYLDSRSGIFQLCWNRDITHFPRVPCDIIATNVHGHVGSEASVKCYENLDTGLGRPAEIYINDVGDLIDLPAENEGSLRLFIRPLESLDKAHEYYRKAMMLATPVIGIKEKGLFSKIDPEEKHDHFEREGPRFK